MAWKDFKIIGFAPDLPNTTPGVLIETRFCMPTDRGIGNGPCIYRISSSTINTQSLGGCLVAKTDGTQRVFIGTATKLYETTSPTPTTLTDRSGLAYSASTTDTWAFTQFGDVTLAINKQNFLQQINTGGAFAAVGAAPVPKASVIVTCGPTSAPVVMVFDYNDGTNDYRDGWFASGLTDAITTTGWTVGTNSCVNGRLIDDIPGPITAAVAWRDQVIAFKRSGMYVGSYGDPTYFWTWRRLSGDIGCIGKNCVIKANDVIYWGDDAGIWMYDGSYPKLVPGAVHSYWANETAARVVTDASRNFFRALWDKPKHLLHMFTASTSSMNAGASWNSISGLWTQNKDDSFAITDDLDTPVEMIAPRLFVTDTKYVGNLNWTGGGTQPHSGQITGWVIGSRLGPTMIKGLRPRWMKVDDTTAPALAYFNTFNTQYDVTVDRYSPQSTVTLSFRSPGKFDGQMAGEMVNWVIYPSQTVLWEMDSVAIDLEQAGNS